MSLSFQCKAIVTLVSGYYIWDIFSFEQFRSKGDFFIGGVSKLPYSKKITKRLCQRFDTTSCSFVRLLVVEHIQILYLFEQTRKGIRMTRIRLKRERERRLMRPVLPGLTRCMRQGLCYKYQAIGIAGSNNLYFFCAKIDKWFKIGNYSAMLWHSLNSYQTKK